MSGREWKKGEVAVVNGAPAVRADHVWHTSTGILSDPNVAHVRPLVVIDPEDREQVERLRDIIREASSDPLLSGADLETALREFADPKPAKPEEPLGLGAVVEDASGNRFIRYGASLAPWIGCASNADIDPDRPYRYWDGIDAVKVLSEGVTP